MPAGTYTINTEPVQDRSYTNKHNTNIVVWRIGLEGAESVAPDKLFELHKREGNVPQRGDTLEVERHFEGADNQGTPFTRLYVASGQSSGGGGGGYSGGGGKSPDQQRSIVRQHSQEMALRFIAMTGDAKDMNFGDATVVSAYLSETVKRLTDWFAADAGSAPKPSQSASNGSPPPEVPADTTGFDSPPASATVGDQSIPF